MQSEKGSSIKGEHTILEPFATNIETLMWYQFHREKEIHNFQQVHKFRSGQSSIMYILLISKLQY